MTFFLPEWKYINLEKPYIRVEQKENQIIKEEKEKEDDGER